MLMLFTRCSRRGLCGFPKPELCAMSSRAQAYCTNYCTNAVDTPRCMATFSDTTIKKDPRFLGSFLASQRWLLVEMGGSRTPRPNSGRSRYATGVSGALVTRRGPSPARCREASPLVLGSA